MGQPKPKDKWRQSGQPSAPQQSVYDDVGQMRLRRHEVGNMWSERTVRTVSASQGGMRRSTLPRSSHRMRSNSRGVRCWCEGKGGRRYSAGSGRDRLHDPTGLRVWNISGVFN